MTKIKKELHGELNGKPVYLYHLKADKIEMSVSEYGLAITEVIVPDKNGNPTDVVLGHGDLDGYVNNNADCFGVVIGRVAGSVEKGILQVADKTYQLKTYNGSHGHGGHNALNRQHWSSREVENGVEFYHFDPDGNEGYPGNLKLTVTVSIIDGCGFRLSYRAESDKDTYISVTNHSYFNLGGHGSGEAMNNLLQINADRYIPVEHHLPTGEIAPVDGTPFDFREMKAIGRDLSQKHPQNEVVGHGYDHFMVLDHSDPACDLHAESAETGIVMEMKTTMPGFYFYTANFTSKERGTGKKGVIYDRYAGFAAETQYFPDGTKHPGFVAPLLLKGRVVTEETEFKFSVK